jgi:hypothetical protein
LSSFPSSKPLSVLGTAQTSVLTSIILNAIALRG